MRSLRKNMVWQAEEFSWNQCRVKRFTATTPSRFLILPRKASFATNWSMSRPGDVGGCRCVCNDSTGGKEKKHTHADVKQTTNWSEARRLRHAFLEESPVRLSAPISPVRLLAFAENFKVANDESVRFAPTCRDDSYRSATLMT